MKWVCMHWRTLWPADQPRGWWPLLKVSGGSSSTILCWVGRPRDRSNPVSNAGLYAKLQQRPSQTFNWSDSQSLQYWQTFLLTQMLVPLAGPVWQMPQRQPSPLPGEPRPRPSLASKSMPSQQVARTPSRGPSALTSGPTLSLVSEMLQQAISRYAGFLLCSRISLMCVIQEKILESLRAVSKKLLRDILLPLRWFPSE